jgi:2-iminobutanoate/2-iminopropanoate deaminase
MPRKVITSEKAPRAIGPYSPAVQTPLYAYTAGQIGLDPATRELVSGGIEAETRQTLTNLSNLLEAAGTSLAAVVKTTVFLRDMVDFERMNAVYAKFFPQEPPARTTVAVVALPRNAAVEIEAVAYLGE